MPDLVFGAFAEAVAVGRVSPQGVTRQMPAAVGCVGLRCANPTYWGLSPFLPRFYGQPQK